MSVSTKTILAKNVCFLMQDTVLYTKIIVL
jgi:hypothetical protein